jgi:hypothetical protein
MLEIANWNHSNEDENEFLVGMAIQNIKFGTGRITSTYRLRPGAT